MTLKEYAAEIQKLAEARRVAGFPGNKYRDEEAWRLSYALGMTPADALAAAECGA